MRAAEWFGAAVVLACVAGCPQDVEPVETDTDTDTDTDSDSDTDTDTDSDTDTDTDTDPSSLPDPFEGLSGDDPDCEDVSGTPVNGATSFFIGDYTLDGAGGVTGTEYWALYANATWASNGGYDCMLVWQVTGTQGDPVSCGGCDYSLSIDATFDPVTSDCPQGLEDEEGQPFSVRYNVEVDETAGTTEFFFTSGTYLGAGHTDGARATWVSDGECVWF